MKKKKKKKKKKKAIEMDFLCLYGDGIKAEEEARESACRHGFHATGITL